MINQTDNSKPYTNYFSVYDTGFVTGDSPVTHDINTNLGRNGTSGYISNDGAGSFIVNLSSDGTTFGDDILFKVGDTLDLEDLSISKVKITWVSDSSYRVFLS